MVSGPGFLRALMLAAVIASTTTTVTPVLADPRQFKVGEINVGDTVAMNPDVPGAPWRTCTVTKVKPNLTGNTSFIDNVTLKCSGFEGYQPPADSDHIKLLARAAKNNAANGGAPPAQPQAGNQNGGGGRNGAAPQQPAPANGGAGGGGTLVNGTYDCMRQAANAGGGSFSASAGPGGFKGQMTIQGNNFSYSGERSARGTYRLNADRSLTWSSEINDVIPGRLLRSGRDGGNPKSFWFEVDVNDPPPAEFYCTL